MDAASADDVDRGIQSVAREVRKADSVVAMTGAGISTASGVPDFRGESGVWERHDPRDFHRRRFERDPAGFWIDRVGLHETMYGDRTIEPNAAHEALARLESGGHVGTIVTQNTDGLHRDAGSEDVIELHGNAHRVVCETCGERREAAPVRERVRDGETPPRCSCGGIYKPDVVLFGEPLVEKRLGRAQSLADRADVFLAIGSSLTVEPAASLPRSAAGGGATLVIVNFDPTPLADRAAYDLRADVTDILPRVCHAVLGDDD